MNSYEDDGFAFYFVKYYEKLCTILWEYVFYYVINMYRSEHLDKVIKCYLISASIS